MKEKVIRLLLSGQTDKALNLEEEMLTRYADDFAEYYGKRLEPVSSQDVLNYTIHQETPIIETMRKSMPGKGPKLPVGATFEGEKRVPRNIVEYVKGY
jgi:hypothetical protein